MNKPKPTLKVTVPTTINLERIQDLLCGAFEGGSAYWASDLQYVNDLPEQCPPDGVRRHHEVCTYPGGVVGIVDRYDEEDTAVVLTLDLPKIQKGLAILAEKYPWHWSNFIQENDDSDTSDAFLQCCLFGDIIYG